MLKKLLFTGVIAAFILLLGKGFLLQSGDMYGFHDITQAGRIADFTSNVRALHLPPRIAPTFSYGLGYPIFNHYAPFGYWLTSDIHLLGFSIPYALKLSFFLAVVCAGVAMYLYAKEHFSSQAALVAGVLYASSPFIGVEVFVRGNIAELWFLALLPLTLYLVHKVAKEQSYHWTVGLAVVFSFLLTAHNALSMVGGLIVGIYAMIMPSKRLIGAIVAGAMMSIYFLVPAVFELSSTHATSTAVDTVYAEHFVCPRQLWNSPLGFGGSTPGCMDGMSFQIGKVLLIMGMLGLGIFLAKTFKKDRSIRFANRYQLFLGGIVVISLFLTVKYSMSVWTALEPVLELFQFPWRFLGIATFGLAFFAAYTVTWIEENAKPTLSFYSVALVCITAMVLSSPFFRSNPDKRWTQADFEKMFLSDEYLRNDIAYRVPEYVPKSVNMQAWLALKDSPQESRPPVTPIIANDGELYTIVHKDPFGFEAATSSRDFIINKHYSPHLKITINDMPYKPTTLDDLGRPRLTSGVGKTFVTVSYVQTPLEKVSNAISLIAFGLLLVPYLQHLHQWKKKS